MYRSSLSLVLRQGARSSTRSLHLTSSLLASKPAHEPASSQGHTTEKAHTTLHKDADVQSASVRAGQDAKNKATGRGTGEDEPFDAARQGNTGGETKGVGAKGPFADQIGGQDEPHKGAGVKKGGSEVAAGYTVTETLKNKVESFIGGGKENRAFSTSTRILASTLPKADPAGARKPKDSKVQGDQNAHLKHTEGGSQGKKGHGNASPDPSLPSKSKSSSSKSSSSENKVPEKDRPSFDKKGQSIPGQVRVFSTSSRALADPNAPGVDAPRPAEKDAQTQAGLRQQPRGDDVEHGGAAGQPSNKSQGAPESSPNPLSGTSAPDPKIPKSQKEGATREGMGVRKFSTFSAARASSPPGGYAKSTKHESTSAGYNAPATALPSGLKSAYQEQDSAAVQGASSDLTPSSKAPYSSSAVDPPNEALRKQVLDGTLPEKNPQPDSEFGRLGNKEAWKHRKLS